MEDECGFKGFSCLSMLYAQHAWLVERISQTFSDEIASFLNDVRDRARVLALPRRLQETVSADGCRYWWIGNPHDCSQRRIYLSVDPRLPQIVWPGELHVQVRCGSAWNSAEESRCCRCARSLSAIHLSEPQALVIPYDQISPIESAASRVASYLIEC